MVRIAQGKGRKSIYRRLLLTLALSSALLIATLSGILYSIYKSSTVGLLDALNDKVLSQISYSLTYVDEISKNYCKSFFLDNDVTAYMWANRRNIINITDSIHSVNKQVIPNQYIDSVYLYNGTLDLFVDVSSGSFSESKDFFDREIAGYAGKGRAGIPMLEPIARKAPAGPNKTDTVDVYTYIMCDVSSSPDRINGMVVINVKTDWLRNIIASLNGQADDFGSEILVLDESGQIVSAESSGLFATDISPEPYVQRIMASGKPSGTFSGIIGGRNYVVSYVSSANPNWKFVSLTPYESAFAEINRMGFITAGFCALVLLAGLAFSLIATRRLYNPIGSLVRRLRSDPDIAARDEDADEIGYLSSAIDRFRGRADELEELNRGNSQHLKEEYLRALLLGMTQYSPGDIRQRLGGADMALRLEEAIVPALLRIDRYKLFTETFNEQERALLKHAAAQAMREEVARQFRSETVDMGGDHFMLLLNAPEAQSASGTDQAVQDMVRALQANLTEKFGLSVTAAVGAAAEHPGALHKAYLSALDLSLYRFKYGHGALLTPSLLAGVRPDEFKLPAPKEKLLLDSLRVGNSEKAVEVLEEIYAVISDYPYEKMQAFVMYLTFTVYNAFGAVRENGKIQLLNDILTGIGSMETLDETKAAFTGLFMRITEKTECKKADKLIQTVIMIIHSEYADKNLCLNVIADRLKMSGAYVGRVFRDGTQISVAEYILKVRLEHVKACLDRGMADIGVILDKAGLEKNNYFYTTFRKHYGVSLSEYKARGAASDK